MDTPTHSESWSLRQEIDMAYVSAVRCSSELHMRIQFNPGSTYNAYKDFYGAFVHLFSLTASDPRLKTKAGEVTENIRKWKREYWARPDRNFEVKHALEGIKLFEDYQPLIEDGIVSAVEG